MSSGAIAISIALTIMLAIIAGIAAYYVRRYRAAPPDSRPQMARTYRGSMALGGAMFVAIGVMTLTQEEPYQGTWWFGVGCAGLGVLMLIAAWIGIPARGKRNN